MIENKFISFFLNKKKTNFFIYGFGQVFNLISPLLVVPKIVLVCGVSAFGKVSLSFSLCLFLILIVDYAFDIKGTKEVSENRFNIYKLQEILNTTIFTKIILFILAFILAILVIFSFKLFYQEKNLFLMSLVIVFAQVFNPVWFLQGIENFKLITALNIGSKLFYVLLVYLLINTKDDYLFVNLFLGLSSLFFNAMGLLIIKKMYVFKIVFPRYNVVKNIIKKDFSFCISQLSLSVRQLSPLVLTSYFLGFSIAGQYKVLEQVISLCRTFIQVFLKFFYPSVCLKYKNNKKEGIHYWKKYTIFIVFIIFSIISIIYCFSNATLQFFHLTSQDINSISSLFKVSLIVSLLMSISLPLEQLMFVQEKHIKYVRTTILITLTNLIIILLFIHSFQLKAIIFSLIFAELLFIFFYYIFTKKGAINNIKK